MGKKYVKKTKEELKEILTPMQFEVTQNDATEPPFQNEYDKHFEDGIYVDITTGEPLFDSRDKFDAGCGWPAFAKPLNDELINEFDDFSRGRHRIEVRSATGDAHLGHVFEDGPEDRGGLRYCINSAAIKFIPRDKVEE